MVLKIPLSLFYQNQLINQKNSFMNTAANNNLLSHNNEVKVAVKEIKEVSTRETSNQHKPSFGNVDMWHVQKLRRDRIYRRYL